MSRGSRGYIAGTYGSARMDAAANYRLQNPIQSVGMSTRAAADALGQGAAQARVHGPGDDAVERELAQAAATGYGVTKPELQDIVRRALDRQGQAKQLGSAARNSLRHAVSEGAFARKSTASLALGHALGTMSPADIGARIGRAR